MNVVSFRLRVLIVEMLLQQLQSVAPLVCLFLVYLVRSITFQESGVGDDLCG